MAKTAWRCSQCGTVNEPGTHACSECGKWPSLFDLQDSPVEEPEPAPEIVHVDVFEAEPFEAEPFEPEPFEPEVFGAEPEVSEEEAEPEEKPSLTRRLVAIIWLIGIVVWLVVNALADRG